CFLISPIAAGIEQLGESQVGSDRCSFSLLRDKIDTRGEVPDLGFAFHEVGSKQCTQGRGRKSALAATRRQDERPWRGYPKGVANEPGTLTVRLPRSGAQAHPDYRRKPLAAARRRGALLAAPSRRAAR